MLPTESRACKNVTLGFGLPVMTHRTVTGVPFLVVTVLGQLMKGASVGPEKRVSELVIVRSVLSLQMDREQGSNLTKMQHAYISTYILHGCVCMVFMMNIGPVSLYKGYERSA